MVSVVELMGLPLTAPDHTTISRRSSGLNITSNFTKPEGSLGILIDSTGIKVYGAGQWLGDKRRKKSARRYRKPHLAVNRSGRVIAQTLTDEYADDPSQVAPLLDQIQSHLASIYAEGLMTDGRSTRPLLTIAQVLPY